MKKRIQHFLYKLGWHINGHQREQLHSTAQDLHSRGQDLLSMQTLPDLDVHYLPWTVASLRPGAMRALLNEVVIHGRESVLEFGSGLSTLYLADFCRSRDAGHVVSVEHDPEWASIVQKYLEEMNVEPKYYTIIEAPLTEVGISGATCDWYDAGTVRQVLRDDLFDTVFVDGPKAFERDKRNARYPALPFASEHLQDDFVVFLDDIGREGEKQIARKWERMYDLGFSRAAGMGVFRPKDTEAAFGIL